MSSPTSWEVNGFDDHYVSGESNCCGAPVYSDSDICTECGEHCEVENEGDIIDCPDCGGLGLVDEEIKESFASTRISPAYKKVKCRLCDGTGIIENIKE